jgi:CO/xanthine dehydrogenase Mo-binding subunit
MSDHENLWVGKSIDRIDSVAKVIGSALYPGDYHLPGQLVMKIVFAERPHAIVRSIDISGAMSVDGVATVLTAMDVPNNFYGLMSPDQPVLCGPGSNNPYGDRVRFVGDQISLVIAEDEETAKKAAKLIKIDFEDLPLVSDPDHALDPGAELLHPNLGKNEFCHFQIRHGDIEKGFAEADVIIESEYHTPMQEHAYLQPEAGIAYYDEEDRITVVVAGQWAHEDREQIAHSLNLSEEKVRVIYPAIGGAFGGREDMSVQIVLALAVMKLKDLGIDRPVKIVWDRRESIIGHHKRHQYKIKTKWGATKEGKLSAIQADITADGGAYMYTTNKVLGNATLMVAGPYFVPNAWVDSKAVCTNNIPGGAFRGFGAPQGCFAAEMQMNKLAEAIGMDPVELRMRNVIQEGQESLTGSALPKGITIEKVIEAAAASAGWNKTDHGWSRESVDTGGNKAKYYGVGFAAGFKNIGFSFGANETSWAGVELHGNTEIERVIVKHAGADVGQGAHTAFKQIAAQALNVPLEIVEMVVSDTVETGSSGSSSASRMTFMAGNSIIGAAKEALKKWADEERPAKAVYTYRSPETTPLDPLTGESIPNFAYGYFAEAIEVKVDKQTGKVKILRVHCADDVGKAINPLQVRGQVEGAVVQAAGYAMLENFIQENGRVRTDNLATYLIPTIMDIPGETKTIILEEQSDIGPFGAKGMAEMPFIPFAPALSSALHDATGHWYDAFPLTEERILKGLGKL